MCSHGLRGAPLLAPSTSPPGCTMSKPDETPRLLPRSASAPSFEWRAALGPWRWLILGTLGVAPSACGGRSGGSDADQDIANLQGESERGISPAPGSTPAP